MLIKPEEAGEPYDRFRGRLMIPDPRRARPGDRVRRPHPRRRASRSISTPRTRRSSTRAARSTTSTSPARPARTAKRLIVVEGYMDVIALDRAGIAEVVAPNGTARHRSAARAHVAARSERRSCASTAIAPGKKAAIRAATARPAAPRPRTNAPLRRASAGPGPRRRGPQRRPRGVRSAARQARAARSPASGATSSRPQPLTTPEARAGLRQRLIDHASAIGDPDLARIYREEWLAASTTSAGPPAPTPVPAPRRAAAASRTAARPRRPPVGRSRARHRLRRESTAPTARALVLGFVNFPEALPAHCEQLACAADRRPQRLARSATAGRSRRSPARRLISEALATILRERWSGGDREKPPAATMGFSFTRRDSDPDRAPSAISAAADGDALTAARKSDAALDGRDRAVEARNDREAFEEQQRLIAAQQGLRQGWRNSPAPIKRRNNMAKNERNGSRHGRGGRCPADRSQRRVDQEDDRPRQEARRHHLRRAERGACPRTRCPPSRSRTSCPRSTKWASTSSRTTRRRRRRGREEAARGTTEDEVDPLDDGGPRPAAATKKEPTDRTDDPVRMYLREMGAVELLCREGEIAIAKRIEAGRDTMIWGLCESPITFNAIIGWSNALNEGRMQLREILDLEAMLSKGPTAEQIDRDRGRRRRRRGRDQREDRRPVDQGRGRGRRRARGRPNEDDEDMVERRARAAGRGRGRGQHSVARPDGRGAQAPGAREVRRASPRSSRNSRRSRRTAWTRCSRRRISRRPTRRSTRSCASSSPPRSRASSSTARKIEYLVEQLYSYNRRLMALGGQMLRLAERHRVPRRAFLESYMGHELDENWLDRVAKHRQEMGRLRRRRARQRRAHPHRDRRHRPADRHLARASSAASSTWSRRASARPASPRRKWSRPTSASSSRSPRNTPTAACSSST